MVHQKRSQVATWANDTLAEEPKKGKAKSAADYLNFDSEESEELSEDGNEPSEDEEETKGTDRSYHPLLAFTVVNVRAGCWQDLAQGLTSTWRQCDQEGHFPSMGLTLCAVDVCLFSQIQGNLGNAVSDAIGVAFVLSPGVLRQRLGMNNRTNICVFPLTALLACSHFHLQDFQSWM